MLNEYFSSALLGTVQGLTEFLPVSSSGHLIIANHLLGLVGERMHIFDVAIQFGSILAVVLLYRQRFIGLLLPDRTKKFSGIRGLYLLFLTSLPASLLGLFLHDYITRHLFNPLSVAAALAVGALFILFAEAGYTRKLRREQAAGAGEQSPEKSGADSIRSLDAVTPRLALGIGLFQCLSLWPGFSRSTSTIMGGLILGADRATAAEYSFIAAVPILTAASAYSLLRGMSLLSGADIPFFLIGLLMAFVAALAAIKVFIGFVSRFSFRPFAWYRLAITPLIFWFWMA